MKKRRGRGLLYLVPPPPSLHSSSSMIIVILHIQLTMYIVQLCCAHIIYSTNKQSELLYCKSQLGSSIDFNVVQTYGLIDFFGYSVLIVYVPWRDY